MSTGDQETRNDLEQNDYFDFVLSAANRKNPVPPTVRNVRVDGSVRVVPRNKFENCLVLEEVEFDEGVEVIGSAAFCGCRSLMNVFFPSTLKAILDCAFYSCMVLEDASLPCGLKYIGDCAFSVTQMYYVDIPASVERLGFGIYESCGPLRSVSLPPRLEVIPNHLFQGCVWLEKIEIPTTVKKIGIGAFGSCCSLTRLDLSHCIHCLTIDSQAFQNCKKLSFLSLPPNIESPIGPATFRDCKLLTHIRVPHGVASVGTKAPERLWESSANAFGGCTSLLSFEVPERLEKLELLPVDTVADDLESDLQFFRRSMAGTFPSLVNLYLPPSQQFDSRFLNEPIPDGFQLAKVATDWGDLVAKLQHRFIDLPLHRACYFHSYHQVHDMVHRIRDILSENPTAFKQVDAFGMTPVHILMLAQWPKVELLQELPHVVDISISVKDHFGSVPLEYLMKNTTVEGMNATRWLVDKVVDQRVPFLGLDRWRQQVLSAKERVVQAVDETTLYNEVESLFVQLAELEFLEVLSTLELILWRIRLGDGVGTDRHSSRVQCGISILMDNVLPFLDDYFGEGE